MAIKSKFEPGREYWVAFRDRDGDLHFSKQYSSRTRTLYRQTTFNGATPWRKHGNDRAEHCTLPGALPKVPGPRIAMLHRRAGLTLAFKEG